MCVSAASRSVLRILVPFVAFLIGWQAIYAQLPPRLKRCLPYPTFADEIAEARASAEAKLPPPRTIVVDTIQFHSSPSLSKSLRKLVINSIQSARFKDKPGWLAEVDEFEIRAPLQDRGYFRVDSNTAARTISESATAEHVALNVSIDPGPQYRTGTVQFRSSNPDQPLAFSTEELRKQMLLHEGTLFSVSDVRQTLSAIRHLYASAGWIDFAPTPEFKIDDANKRIDTTLELDQGKQYRIGQIQILGHDPAVEQMIRSKLKSGGTFDGGFLQQFYSAHKSILPPGASFDDDVVITQDPRRGIANLRIDLSACPQDSE